MTMEFSSLILVFLLPLTTGQAVTAGQNLSIATTTDVMTHSQLTAQDSSSSHPPTGITTMIHQNLTQPGSSPSLQTTPTASLKTHSPNLPTTATKSQSSTQSRSTLGQETATPTTKALTSQASNQTPTSSGATESQDLAKTSTPQITSNKTHHPSTQPSPATDLISTSTTPAESKSPSPVPNVGATESISVSRTPKATPKATTKAPLIHTTKANKGQDPPTKPSSGGKAVAWIIGGALALMMLGFLIIYLKKRKLRKQQITTSDWAGPSPFLEGGVDNGQVELRSNNRISLSSFLPQRLSKRLSLLPETEEEMENLTPGSTFGDKPKGNSFGQEVAGNSVKESNGTAGETVDIKSTGDSAQTIEKTQNSDLLTTNNNSEDAKPSPDLSSGPTLPPADGNNPPEHLSSEPEQP